MKGTLALSFGPWGGFYVHRGFSLRLSLGWLAITWLPDELDTVLGSYQKYAQYLAGQRALYAARLDDVYSRFAGARTSLLHVLRFDWGAKGVSEAEISYVRRYAALCAGLQPGSDPRVTPLGPAAWDDDPFDIVEPVHPLDYPEEDFSRG